MSFACFSIQHPSFLDNIISIQKLSDIYGLEHLATSFQLTCRWDHDQIFFGGGHRWGSRGWWNGRGCLWRQSLRTGIDMEVSETAWRFSPSISWDIPPKTMAIYGYIWSTIYRLITGTPLPIWGSTLGRPWDEVTLLVDQFRSVWWAKQWILNETLKMVVNQRIKGSTHIYQNLFFCAHQEQVVNGCSTELEKPKSCYRWGLNRAQILFSAPVRIVKGLPQPDRCSVDE